MFGSCIKCKVPVATFDLRRGVKICNWCEENTCKNECCLEDVTRCRRCKRNAVDIYCNWHANSIHRNMTTTVVESSICRRCTQEEMELMASLKPCVVCVEILDVRSHPMCIHPDCMRFLSLLDKCDWCLQPSRRQVSDRKYIEPCEQVCTVSHCMKFWIDHPLISTSASDWAMAVMSPDQSLAIRMISKLNYKFIMEKCRGSYCFGCAPFLIHSELSSSDIKRGICYKCAPAPRKQELRNKFSTHLNIVCCITPREMLVIITSYLY